MKKNITQAFSKLLRNKALLILPVILFSLGSNAQLRNFGLLYSDNVRGDVTIFGNTLMNLAFEDGTPNIVAMNDNSATGNSNYTNGFQNMQYVDIDGSSGDGAATRNSSSSDLILPSGTNTIKLARLYWGGRAVTTDFNLAQGANETIKIRKGTTGAYTELAALQIDKFVTNPGAADEFTLYQAFTDITDLVTQEGAGTYTVGNAPLSVGNGGNAGNYGGWSIVVIYENPALSFNSIRVYDGYQQVWNLGNPLTSTFTLTGLNVPSGALSLTDAKMSIMTWEGDANYTDDYLKINNNLFSNATNPSNNPMNGTITNNGVHVTTKNPNYTNQMGIDIDNFDIGTGYGITPNATSINLEFGTALDQYFPGLFAFVIKMKDPSISLSKTVSDADNNDAAEPGEILTYRLKGKNIAGGNANFVSVVDTLPASITYLSNSLRVIYSPGTDAGTLTDNTGDDVGEYIENGTVKTVRFRLGNGSNATLGGTLAPADSFEVEFKATVNFPANGSSLGPIVNVARMKASSDAAINYVDDGTAIINPLGGVLPVKLTSFSANLITDNLVKINWATATELNCSRYEIERSTDSRAFTKVATVAGSGNTFTNRLYQITDDIKTVNSNWVYYRLNQVDFDGRSTYSKVVSIKLKKGNNNFTVSPNPFSSYITVNIDWGKNENSTLKVYNIVGKEIVSKPVQLFKGSNYIPIDEMNGLPAGNYIIQFITADEKIFKQVTKQ